MFWHLIANIEDTSYFLADSLAQIQLLLGSKHMIKAGVKVKSIIVLRLHSKI